MLICSECNQPIEQHEKICCYPLYLDFDVGVKGSSGDDEPKYYHHDRCCKKAEEARNATNATSGESD